MHTRREFLASTAALALTGFSSAQTADPPADDPASWAQFLGPRRDGVSRETGLNTDWNAKKPAVVWKAALGRGFSSVAVVGSRVWTMQQRGQRDGVVCLDGQTGKEVWFHDGAASYTDKQKQGPGPRSTPTVHQGKVFCLLPGGELQCLKAADGKLVWKVDIFQAAKTSPRSDVYYWGMSGSPLVEGDHVIVQPGGTKDNSLAAFHKDTGKLVWGAGSDPAGYSSPIALTAAGKRQIVSFTGQGALGVDPAKGEVLWRYALGNKFDCNCATPLFADNLLFLSSAYKTGCAAVEIAAEGQKVIAKEKWRNGNLLNQFPTSVIVAGHVYGCHGDLGACFAKCIELATGQVKWDDRRPGKCSLLAYDGHIVLVSEQGAIRLIEANPKSYVQKGQIDDLLTYKSWAQPALLEKRLYLRDDKQLVCLDLAKG